MGRRRVPVVLPLLLAFWPIGTSLAAQGTPAERAAVLAVVEAALEAISAEDMVALTDLMLDGTVTYQITGDEVERRTREQERRRTLRQDWLERGFAPEIRIAGGLATVWMPYDFYLDGEFTHCGVDTFTMIRIEGRWRIAGMAWTVQQPPQCRRHPNGPPRTG